MGSLHKLMDHRSSKREHRGENRGSKAYGESKAHGESKHHRPAVGAERRASENSRLRPSHREPPIAEHIPDLNGDDDYVRTWLARTEQEKTKEDARPKTRGKEAQLLDTKREPELELRSFRQAARDADSIRKPSKRKRRHRSSSDSSLLEPVAKPQPKLRKEDHRRLEPELQDELWPKQHAKLQAPESDMSSSASSIVRQEMFEKRDRHKTREDLYEPKKKKHKSDRQDKPEGERKRRKKREKRGDRKKESKKAADNLMTHFSSKNVGQERLTMRPSHGPGLFKNGRASSPVQRRGLPDLVFSEMEFLQRPTRQLAPTNASRATSKSREKDKRKVLREQDEISTFFKPPKEPLAQVSPNARKERSSTYTSGDRSLYMNQGAKGQAQRHSKYAHSPEKHYLGFDTRAPSPVRYPVTHGRTPSSQAPRVIPNTTSRRSEKTTSGVTWSESQLSPGATAASRRRSKKYDIHASSTPESVRIAIESTGVFKDTGIGNDSGIQTFRLAQAQLSENVSNDSVSHGSKVNVEDWIQVGQMALLGDSGRSKSYESVPEPSKLTSKSQVQQAYKQKPDQLIVARESRTLTGKSTSVSQEVPMEREPNRRSVEHYETETDRHQKQRPSPLEETATPPVAPLTRSKSTSMTREELAKFAYIRPRSTIRPAPRVTETSLPCSEDKSRDPTREAIQKRCVDSRNSARLSSSDRNFSLLHVQKLENSGSREVPTHDTQPNRPNSSASLRMSRSAHGHVTEAGPLVQARNGPEQESKVGNDATASNRSSLTRSELPNLQPADIAGLPVRGPSQISLGLSSRAHVPPMVGHELLYFSQIQRQPILDKQTLEQQSGHDQQEIKFEAFHPSPVVSPELIYFNRYERDAIFEQPVLENNTGSVPHETDFENLYPDLASYAEEINDDILGLNEYENVGCPQMVCQHDSYDYHIHKNMEAPQTWQPMDHENGRRRDYEMLDQSQQHVRRTFHGEHVSRQYDTLDGQTLQRQYGMEQIAIVHDNLPAEEENLSLRGFWKSHRQY